MIAFFKKKIDLVVTIPPNILSNGGENQDKSGNKLSYFLFNLFNDHLEGSKMDLNLIFYLLCLLQF